MFIVRCFTIAVFCVMSLSAHAFGECMSGSEMGWIGLYNNNMLDWLENQNKIDAGLLCPKSTGAEARSSCIQEHLKPMSKRIDVRKDPDPLSPLLGQIEIIAKPGEGLSAVWRTLHSSRPFKPDLYDADWGYGPYFHMTALSHRDSWFLLPRNPLPDAGWIDINQLTEAPDFKKIAPGEVYMFADESITITNIEKNTITFRDEQPADMWCQSGEPPQMYLRHLRKFRISELFNKDCHLKLTVKYTRGC